MHAIVGYGGTRDEGNANNISEYHGRREENTLGERSKARGECGGGFFSLDLGTMLSGYRKDAS